MPRFNLSTEIKNPELESTFCCWTTLWLTIMLGMACDVKVQGENYMAFLFIDLFFKLANSRMKVMSQFNKYRI